MGQLEALTVRLLGRSPYSEVVPGEGAPDPLAPPQEYDSRGRPVNRETRRRNREIIQQAHNELMLTIGVAEAELTSLQSAARARALRTQLSRRDHLVSRRIGHAANIARIVGVWGLSGMRQRMLIYPQCAWTPLFENAMAGPLAHTRPWPWNDGLGLVLVYEVAMLSLRHYFPRIVMSSLGTAAAFWLNMHVGMFATLRRLDLVPPSFFPWPTFFVPFMSGSLIGSPLPWRLMSRESLWRWVVDLGLGLLPAVAMFVGKRALMVTERYISRRLGAFVPIPASSTERIGGRHLVEDRPSTPPQARPSSPRPPALPPHHRPSDAADAPSYTRRASITHSEAHNPQSSPDDGSATDDETENDVSTGVVISFDVESAEGPEAAAAAPWAAELRATPTGTNSVTNDTTTAPQAPLPMYHSTYLTRLPHYDAVRTLSSTLNTIVSLPFELAITRIVACAWCARTGLVVPGMYTWWEIGRLWTTGAMTNFIGLAFGRLVATGAICVGVCVAAEWWYVTEDEWVKRAEEVD